MFSFAENGPIDWSRTLPEHCQLSAGLKALVTPLLAGLLEENQKRMWSFERFFWEVMNILNKRVLHIFHVNRASSIEVFMEPEDRIFHVKEHVILQSDVSADSQLLLIENELLEDRVGIDSVVKGYPVTSNRKPIILFNIENNNVSMPRELELSKFPSFPAGISVENDASLAKLACSVGHECKRRVENYSKTDSMIQRSVDSFVAYLKKILSRLLDKSRNMKEVLDVVHDLVETTTVLAFQKSSAQNQMTQLNQEFNEIKTKFTRISEPIEALHNRFFVEDQLKNEWKSSSREIKNPSKNHSNEKAKYLVDKLRDSWQVNL